MSTNYIPALRYSFLTSVYDPIVKLTTRESFFKQSLLGQANIHSGERVLDVGCGTGTLAIAASALKPGATIEGLDGDPKILNIARNKAKREDLDLRFTQSLSTEMPFDNESFDKVMSTLFFHHLTTDAKAATLKEIYRILRPGGQLHVADWGKPTRRASRWLFFSIQLLDGFETTADNLRGKLPAYFADAGFQNVLSTQQIETIFGTLSLYQAEKPRTVA
ncbi:MAG: class I SAM-dependent methyltransferase [Gammaproteobacteria bacterium]|nr:class I SAM-dependent methyltransferase [Gammaproteobacteria bacterium]